MKIPTRRRFDRIDAMVLIGATALGAAMVRDVFELYTSTAIDNGRHNPRGFRLYASVTVPLFVAWSLALIPLRCRRPRARFRLLARHPGFAAVLVVAAFTLKAVAEQAISHHRIFGAPTSLFRAGYLLFAIPSWLVFIGDSAGFAILATWLALWIGRWWRFETSWIDRAGRALGCYWVALFFAWLSVRAAS